jgi:chromosome segregation ATPase
MSGLTDADVSRAEAHDKGRIRALASHDAHLASALKERGAFMDALNEWMPRAEKAEAWAADAERQCQDALDAQKKAETKFAELLKQATHAEERRQKAEADRNALKSALFMERELRSRAEAELAAFVDYFDTWDVSPPQLTRLLNELRVAGRDSGEASRNEGPESAVGPEGSRRQAAAKSAARCPCGYGEPHERECGM